MNLANLIDSHPADHIAVIDGADTTTYGELRARVDALRTHLVGCGVIPGDHVLLVCGNEAHFVTALLAIFGAGAAAAPINPYSTAPELAEKAEAVAPRLCILGDTAGRLREPAEGLGVALLNMDDVPTSCENPTPIVARSDDDLACLLPTSGVSALPKVAMLSHGNLATTHRAIVGEGPHQVIASDVVLSALPVAHVLGLNGVVLSSLAAGATVVMQRRFNVDDSLSLIRSHKVTMLTGAPPMWQRWAEADAPADSLQSVRFARSGAAALPAPVFEKLRDRYGIEVRQGYGLTESSSVVATGRGLDVRPTSVGKPIAEVDLVLVDENGEPVDIGDIGEIVLKGPGVFLGYLGAPEATEAVLSHDGWLWTGDVGLFDDDGYLYLVDRVKDIIIVSGFNVYPAEIENVLMRHPDVRGAVVVGGPHGLTGETVIAHVSGTADEESLTTFAREHLSGYKCPTEYHFVDELPVSNNGKAVRRELRS